MRPASQSPAQEPPPEPLSIEELEAGLRLLGRGDTDQNVFWDENITAFRQTVLLAIRETSDALLSARIASRWRILLERQLDELVRYLELADRYIARGSINRERPASAPQSPGQRIH